MIGAAVLMVIGSLLFTMTPKVDRNKQIVGQAVRNALNIQERALENADYQKVTELNLRGAGLTDLKPLLKCTGLVKLDLSGNPDLTKAQIDELQKALSKCKITHDGTTPEDTK